MYIEINPDLTIAKDIDIFISENSGTKLLDIQEYIFLYNVYIRNCIEFEKWVVSIRSVYENMFIKRLKTGLKNSIKINDMNYIERFSRKIIAIDSCDEVAYRNLMDIQAKKGFYNDAIKLYSKLIKNLNEELDLDPEEETIELYKKIVSMKALKDTSVNNEVVLFGRMSEIIAINEEYEKFLKGDIHNNCIISGDIGSGKSGMIDNFIKSHNIKKTIEIEFNVMNSKIDYYAIRRIIQSILDENHIDNSSILPVNSNNEGLYYAALIENILSFFERQGKNNIVILKNIESIDIKSFDIIISSFIAKRSKNIFLLGEYCQSFKTDYEILIYLEAQEHLKVLNLRPLDEQETVEYLNLALKNKQKSNSTLSSIYKYTQGNLMLIHDVLGQIVQNGNKDEISLKMSNTTINKIKEMIASFSNEEIEFMEWLSVFKNGLEVETISKIMSKDKIAVLDIVDKLFNRGLLKEIAIENHITIKIKTRLISDMIYNAIKDYKKFEIHKLAAEFYEKKYLNDKKDYFYISELQYHYNFTNNLYEKLYYSLVYMEYKLDYSDEMFPTLKSYEHSPANFYINKEKIFEEFEACEALLNMLEDLLDSDRYYELRMRFDFLKGRTLSRSGQKEKGIVYTNELIDLAQKLKREDFLLKGYLEKVYFGIKTGNKDLMAEYIKKAHGIKNIAKYEVERGILYRLEGLCNIMGGDYLIAEELLWKSIKLFSLPKYKNTNFINIAAAYAYLGYCCRYKGEYDEAEKYLKKAINICLEKNIKKSLDLFYEDLGFVFFLRKQYTEAEKYFKKSIELYDEFGTYWLRSIGESCLALINMYKGNSKEALEHFRRAEIFSKKDFVKEEIEVLEMARKELKEKGVI